MSPYLPVRRRILSDAEIVRLYVDERLDSETVGAAAHCSGSTVLDLVRAAGHEVRRAGSKRQINKLTDDEIIRRYRAGQAGKDIAADAGCTPSTVYHILDREGVPRRVDPATRAYNARQGAKATKKLRGGGP